METGGPFKLLIETETTRDTASCNTTTPFQLTALPPQQDPETEIICDTYPVVTVDPCKIPIEREPTVEEDTAVYENTTLVQSYASSPLQEHESQLIRDRDPMETTVQEGIANYNTASLFQSVTSPPHQEHEYQLIGVGDLMKTVDKLPIENETTVEESEAVQGIQYLPKVWKRAVARERTLWRLAFFIGDPKNPIFVGSR